MSGRFASLPAVRGTIRRHLAMAPLTWLRVGGPAAAVFQPADLDDLRRFRAEAGADLPVLPVGVASNLLIRDGGIEAVVIRQGGPLAAVEIEGGRLLAGAGALDQRTAQVAQAAGLSGIEFMFGIPGTIGGAVRMNAGAFGGETAERLAWVEIVDPTGRVHRLAPDEIGHSYRHSALPADAIVVRAAFDLVPGDRDAIRRRMAEIKAEREAAQPLRVATGGSTFKNPPGTSAWKLIDQAGCRGLRLGSAMVSEKHCNFLINTGAATATEVEDLGDLVRERVLRATGVTLEWEVIRIGARLGMENAA